MRYQIRESLTPSQVYEILSHMILGLIRSTTNEHIRATLVDAVETVRDRLCPEEADK